MSADWYPRAETLPGCLATIAEIASVEVALAFAARYGAQQRYIPDPDQIDREHWLAQALGLQVARLFAARAGRGHVGIPSAKTERNALNIRRLWAEGYSINAIVAQTKLSRNLVKKATRGISRDGTSRVLETQSKAHRCALCGRRLALNSHRRDNPAQLDLPLSK